MMSNLDSLADLRRSDRVGHCKSDNIEVTLLVRP